MALCGLLSASVAAQAPDAKPTHAIRGIVKTINTSSLVITTGSGKKIREMTFRLTPSTHHEGEPIVGDTVSIRYLMDRDTLTATAVSVHHDVW
jgi:hypothetical protein